MCNTWELQTLPLASQHKWHVCSLNTSGTFYSCTAVGPVAHPRLFKVQSPSSRDKVTARQIRNRILSMRCKCLGNIYIYFAVTTFKNNLNSCEKKLKKKRENPTNIPTLDLSTCTCRPSGFVFAPGLLRFPTICAFARRTQTGCVALGVTSCVVTSLPSEASHR